MVRVIAFIVSVLAAGALLAGEASAQQHRRAGPAARPAAAARPAPRAAPRMVAPRMARPHVAPRMAAPRHFAAPRRVIVPHAGPRVVTTPRISPGQGTRNLRRHQIATPAPRATSPQLASPNARQLRLQQRLQRQQVVTQRRIDRLQQRADRGRLDARGKRQLQRLQARQQQLNKNINVVQRPALRPNGKPRLTADAARQGRFAARFHRDPNWEKRRHARIAARMAARQAWRHHRRAAFVAWVGPVFWPYAYSDLFDYTFWPYAYDDAYWAYVYDDFFDSVYWAGPSPYADDYYYAGPYEGGYASAAPGAKQTARARAIAQTAQQLCKEPGQGITAWPFDRIEEAVRPTPDQQNLLEQVKQAAAKAAEDFKSSCSTEVPMTPPGRLQAMLGRLQATLAAVRAVRPPLERFYGSLSDEQKARFNVIGPDIGREEARATQRETQGRAASADDACGGGKAGLTGFPIEAIEDAVRPTGDQQAALDRLNDANDKAVQALQAACPDAVALTPVGRLEAMEQRLNAMVTAANTVRPALDDFYASLSSEQKERFNRLGSKQAAQ
ncbi:MAG TPA: Spy/CpxP family protein refolding chaperone [Pseudorhodoplanes sp.]|jgi:hypothetical protein|nr:Spy/CpxP family protein refolding chaperone [Pseudorhodoplanes sp.]